jgi:hypothetical protein
LQSSEEKPKKSRLSKGKNLKQDKDEDEAFAMDVDDDDDELDGLIPKKATGSRAPPKKKEEKEREKIVKEKAKKKEKAKEKEKEKEEPKQFKYVFPLSFPHPRLFLCSTKPLLILIALLSWAAARAAKLAGPSAPGSKEVPEGVPDCLLGLSFVFTGELSAFSREEAINIAKRYGGYVVSLAYNTFTALTHTPQYLPAHPTHPQPRRRPTLLENRLRHPRRGWRPLQARRHQETRSHHSKRGRVSQLDRYEGGTGREGRQVG